jgi:hypothetical protein
MSWSTYLIALLQSLDDSYRHDQAVPGNQYSCQMTSLLRPSFSTADEDLPALDSPWGAQHWHPSAVLFHELAVQQYRARRYIHTLPPVRYHPHVGIRAVPAAIATTAASFKQTQNWEDLCVLTELVSHYTRTGEDCSWHLGDIFPYHCTRTGGQCSWHVGDIFPYHYTRTGDQCSWRVGDIFPYHCIRTGDQCSWRVGDIFPYHYTRTGD